ncbi:MAG TPA: cyclic nucleotide-binding domain-containing protein [Spirochaetales bacterium]|nr:cyclic nucleotide-binding domain-containing protein [Spirochaetales bacterium]HRY53481.1 cyclic nucleotide-binding domain-containing protein [Spirochaetia bacterium]HRZ65758.1 cyclic nucleotide-binding domain-containing protein [Spirochaetia bacterium]
MVDTAALQKYSLFGGLLPEEVERIRPLLGHEEHAPGELVMREGEPNDRIYFIVEGRVEVSRRGVVLVELGEGETFGEMELLDVMPSAATVKVLAPLSVATITNRAVHEIFRLEPRSFALIMMNLARDLSRRLRRMDGIVSGA